MLYFTFTTRSKCVEVMRIKARSFPRATLLEHCSLLGTDNVREQISEHIFAPKEAIVYIATV